MIAMAQQATTMMATARRAMARQDRMTTTMATGKRWQRHDGRRRDRIGRRQLWRLANDGDGTAGNGATG